MYLWEKMGIIASNPCFFTFAIGTFIGVRGVYFVLKKLNQKGPKIEQETKREVVDQFYSNFILQFVLFI